MTSPPGTTAATTSVVVTGMHRSGTSMAARLVQIAGVDLGDPAALLPAGPDNPTGYWENKQIKELDDEILAELGGSWDAPPVLGPGWELAPGLDPFRDRARAALDTAFDGRPPTAGATRTVGWKDPRLSLLLPFWQTVQAIDATVVVVRDPADVASSLRTRNGIEEPQAALLWLRYVLAGIAAHPRHLIVRHPDLYEDAGGVLDQLCGHLGLPAPTEEQRVEASAHVDVSLRHHGADTSPATPLGQMAAEVWDDGRVDVTALDTSTTRAISEGWLRPPTDGEQLARARAKVVKLQETVRRRAAKAAGA